jgi:hypothetical protein
MPSRWYYNPCGPGARLALTPSRPCFTKIPAFSTDLALPGARAIAMLNAGKRDVAIAAEPGMGGFHVEWHGLPLQFRPLSWSLSQAGALRLIHSLASASVWKPPNWIGVPRGKVTSTYHPLPTFISTGSKVAAGRSIILAPATLQRALATPSRLLALLLDESRSCAANAYGFGLPRRRSIGSDAPSAGRVRPSLNRDELQALFIMRRRWPLS